MRSAPKFLTALLSALCLLFIAAPAKADTPDAVNWPKPRFLSYNVCGGKCGIYQQNPSAWRDKTIAAMDGWDDDVIMFQEMCYAQWQLLRDSLATRASQPYDTVWGAALPSADGCRKWIADPLERVKPDTTLARFGLAIFVKGGTGTIDLSTRSVTMLPNPMNAEQRILLCARANVKAHNVRVCDTHIDFTPGNQGPQVAQVASVTKSYSNQGDPVALGGDFNMPPGDANLNPLYDNHGGTGIFGEADENDTSYYAAAGCSTSESACRSGEPTEDSTCSSPTTLSLKIDYIFLDRRSFNTLRGDAAACTAGMSDHHLLRGAAAFS
ncbi:endonuclease/exonuclease/phosphatase family protein [Kitasatospora sp. NPDC058046]|uniref:endonuclease/exonuclease/phosphatase family protein n=1 Tax=Kitasatospora sp. NPDC058046 TaxID=3346312 RepID=UPI0036DF4FD2